MGIKVLSAPNTAAAGLCASQGAGGAGELCRAVPRSPGPQLLGDAGRGLPAP